MHLEKDDKILLIIPPFTLLESPNLGVHSLQEIASKNGFNINVLYSDQLFAKTIGVDKYEIISNELLSTYEQIPERLFASFAYDDFPFMGKRTNNDGILYESHRSDNNFKNISWKDLLNLKNKINEWLVKLCKEIAASNPKVVGLSTSHLQTNASLAILKRLKKLKPEIITIIGGSNCDGNMSKGILSVGEYIDFIFSGESEQSFLKFLNNLKKGILPKEKIIKGLKISNLDDLPLPNYKDYYNQLYSNGLANIETWITYESSRGCWWGQSNLCTFCGINGSVPKYRAKKSKKVLTDLVEYMNRYPTKNIRMVDVLMPRNYLRTLIPELETSLPDVSIFYEQRADMTFEQMSSLKKSGIEYMQIGIESFSNSQLTKLKKGTSIKDNIDTLRFAKALGIVIGWNMLTEIPSDTIEEWNFIDKILPLLYHLNPPTYFRPIEITRFSPYFNSPSEFGITAVKPFDVYFDIFPELADIYNLAWLFTGEYQCNSREDIEKQKTINKKTEQWINLWCKTPEEIPVLEIIKYEVDKFLLRDTRLINDGDKIQFLNYEKASVALLGDKSEHFINHKHWAIENNLLVEVEHSFLAIATSNSYIINQFLNE